MEPFRTTWTKVPRQQPMFVGKSALIAQSRKATRLIFLDNTVAFLSMLISSISNSQAQIDALDAKLTALTEQTDTVWIMVSTFLVMFMQAGFAMLEMGTVRSKNAQNILLKNLLDISCATVIWFLVG